MIVWNFPQNFLFENVTHVWEHLCRNSRSGPYPSHKHLNGEITLFSYNTIPLIRTRAYRPLYTNIHGSCIMVHKNILRLDCLSISMLEILVCGLDQTSAVWIHYSSDLNPFDLFFWGHLKLIVSQMPLDKLQNLTTVIVIPSTDIASRASTLERIRQSFICRF